MLIQHALPRLKPLGGPVLRVRRGHPLATELRALILCGGTAGLGIDLVTGVVLDGVNAPSLGITPEGPALDVSGTAYASGTSHPDWNVTGDITLAWRGMVRSTASAGSLVNKIPAGGSGATDTPFALEYTNPTAGRASFVRSNSAYAVWETTSNVLTANVLTTLSVNQGSAIEVAPTFYADGVPVSATRQYNASGNGAPNGNTGPIILGRRPDGAEQQDGQSLLVLVAATQWDASQHAGFHTDPYDILGDAPLYHFLPPGLSPLTAEIAGSIPLTGSATATLDLAAAMAGTIPLTGTITAQLASTGDTHDGFVRRSRRQRALDAAERRRREAVAQEAVTLRLSLQAAMGMAAEVVEEAPAEAVEAVQAVARKAARLVPTLADTRADEALLASAREAVAALRAAVDEAARAKALAEDDEDVMMLLRAL